MKHVIKLANEIYILLNPEYLRTCSKFMSTEEALTFQRQMVADLVEQSYNSDATELSWLASEYIKYTKRKLYERSNLHPSRRSGCVS